MTPREILLVGVDMLKPVACPHGFTFEIRDEGRGSGGFFAWGEFVRGDRRLELHFRYRLGLVKYHFGTLHAEHETYMNELGALGRNRYPGFSDDPLDGFRHLAYDLHFATDFLSGSADILRSAASRQSDTDRENSGRLMAGYVGDTQALEQIQSSFRAGRYDVVLSVFQKLQFPERLTKAQQRMVEIARERAR